MTGSNFTLLPRKHELREKFFHETFPGELRQAAGSLVSSPMSFKGTVIPGVIKPERDTHRAAFSIQELFFSFNVFSQLMGKSSELRNSFWKSGCLWHPVTGCYDAGDSAQSTEADSQVWSLFVSDGFSYVSVEVLTLKIYCWAEGLGSDHMWAHHLIWAHTRISWALTKFGHLLPLYV